MSVTPDGERLIVTERVSNRIESLGLDFFGRPGAPVVTASNGATPFGFAFGPDGALVVSEAGASTVSVPQGFAGRPRHHAVAARQPGRGLLGRRLA